MYVHQASKPSIENHRYEIIQRIGRRYESPGSTQMTLSCLPSSMFSTTVTVPTEGKRVPVTLSRDEPKRATAGLN